jgi:hypothetical protein
MKRKQILVAGEDQVGAAVYRELQKLVVLRITTGPDSGMDVDGFAGADILRG